MAAARVDPAADRVGWTAYFTAAVWANLGEPRAEIFLTRRGEWMRQAVKWGGATLGLWGRFGVERLFLSGRHGGFDRLLADIAPAQVIELAAGFSARGVDWKSRLPVTYIEIDGLAVIAAKERMLDHFLLLPSSPPPTRPILIAADLLQTEGQALLDRLSGLLDPARSTVIIAEGLTGYLGQEALSRLLESLRTLTASFDDVSLLIDFYLRLDWPRFGRVAVAMAPARLLWRLLRAPMRMFLRDAAAIRALVASAGFEVAELYSSADLANLTGLPRPGADLFYVARLRPVGAGVFTGGTL